jgi:hypothetical protein
VVGRFKKFIKLILRIIPKVCSISSGELNWSDDLFESLIEIIHIIRFEEL